jgi:hypothetical protein
MMWPQRASRLSLSAAGAGFARGAGCRQVIIWSIGRRSMNTRHERNTAVLCSGLMRREVRGGTAHVLQTGRNPRETRGAGYREGCDKTRIGG